MKKNLFDLFLDKVMAFPLWVRQVIYLKLHEDMKANLCCEFLQTNTDGIFSLYEPVLTFKGKTELIERANGLDTNIYNFLHLCSENYNIIDISLNTFLSIEEVAKYFVFCLEQNYVKTPENKEIIAMSGFIAGKFRTGEYYKQRGTIDVDQLRDAMVEEKRLKDANQPKLFGEILLSLGFITEEDIKSLMILKEEAKKRFILDYNTVPKTETVYSSSDEKYEKEIAALKKENEILKRKMVQLLELVKKNAG